MNLHIKPKYKDGFTLIKARRVNTIAILNYYKYPPTSFTKISHKFSRAYKLTKTISRPKAREENLEGHTHISEELTHTHAHHFRGRRRLGGRRSMEVLPKFLGES
jgi:hypothetical protein